ncbi:MAG: SIS domain-containing protein [Lentisphaeria bacterium]|nr:SIS domain-containing protein [Lentisphaeria bacterium]NQZ67966.1 SIS domain-containing protein [Lentisphaeria bacterium]
MLYFDELLDRYPVLSPIKDDLLKAYAAIEKTTLSGGTLYFCGNGGSASDAEHIVGELIKSFCADRSLSSDEKSAFAAFEDGGEIANQLEKGIRAIALTSHVAFSTAFANDVNPELVFAQQLYTLGRKGDLLMGITTSGNSKNVLQAMKVARVLGIQSVLLSGNDGGLGKPLADISIVVPLKETYQIQELHLPIYHWICRELESCVFEGE